MAVVKLPTLPEETDVAPTKVIVPVPLVVIIPFNMQGAAVV